MDDEFQYFNLEYIYIYRFTDPIEKHCVTPPSRSPTLYLLSTTIFLNAPSDGHYNRCTKPHRS